MLKLLTVQKPAVMVKDLNLTAMMETAEMETVAMKIARLKKDGIVKVDQV